MSSVIEPLTVTAAWGVGLIAGLFFVFSVAIMPAFARLAAPTAIAAMRAINVVIVPCSSAAHSRAPGWSCSRPTRCGWSRPAAT
jgi:uncharacterized membrane protein